MKSKNEKNSDALIQALEKNKLVSVFQNLPPSHQKEYLKWINEAKKENTRQLRIEKTLLMLKNHSLNKR